MRRLAVVLLVAALTGCGGGDEDTESVGQASPTLSPACASSGQGTTDLAEKPVVTKPTTPPPSETTVIEIVCGTGDLAKSGSKVSVKYVGVLYADGKEFDASWNRGADETITFDIGSGVIPGFSTGATGMRVGGRRMVVIPAKDGYGARGIPPTIPPNATLIFVMDLVKVS
jgi:peptidylprolyl isomerase